MSSATTEYGHRPLIEAGESHSPFLTDRETAELTALTTLGPLALVAFDTQTESGLRTAPEIAAEPKVPDTVTESDDFDRAELALIMHQQQNVARAAIMFAEARLN